MTTSGQGLQLYSYWRSSAAYRVRLALAWKGLSAEIVPDRSATGRAERRRRTRR